YPPHRESANKSPRRRHWLTALKVSSASSEARGSRCTQIRAGRSCAFRRDAASGGRPPSRMQWERRLSSPDTAPHSPQPFPISGQPPSRCAEPDAAGGRHPKQSAPLSRLSTLIGCSFLVGVDRSVIANNEVETRFGRTKARLLRERNRTASYRTNQINNGQTIANLSGDP